MTYIIRNMKNDKVLLFTSFKFADESDFADVLSQSHKMQNIDRNLNPGLKGSLQRISTKLNNLFGLLIVTSIVVLLLYLSLIHI